MTPVALIANVRADGIVLGLSEDGRLTFKGPRSATEKWLPSLAASKPDLVVHLRREARGTNWDAQDWRAFYNERAALYDQRAGAFRATAKNDALEATVAEWLRRTWQPSSQDSCVECGATNAVEPLLPFGGQSVGHVWLHRSCWPAWSDGRKAEAVEALMTFGVGGSDVDRNGQRQRR